jgi:hypothetical protein
MGANMSLSLVIGHSFKLNTKNDKNPFPLDFLSKIQGTTGFRLFTLPL